MFFVKLACRTGQGVKAIRHNLIPWWNPDRIFEDFWRSSRTCQRSLKIRIFRRSYKDL